MRSAGSGSPWNSVDDVWRTMSDPTPPRLNDFSTQGESSLNMARVKRTNAKGPSLGVHATIATIETGQHEKIADPAETRLWRIAGALMVLAVGVLGVLGWLTFSPGAASVAASIVHNEPMRVPDAPRPHATPLPAASVAAPVEAPVVTASKQQRPNKHHAKQKAHKRGRVAKRR